MGLKLAFGILLLVVLVSSRACAVNGEEEDNEHEHVGGIVDVPDFQYDRQIQNLGGFSVFEYDSRVNEKDRLMFVRVVKAQKQVVQGTLYYLTVKTLKGVSQYRNYLAKVWVKPGLKDKKLVSFTPV